MSSKIIFSKSYTAEEAAALEHEVGSAYEHSDLGDFTGELKVLVWYEPAPVDITFITKR